MALHEKEFNINANSLTFTLNVIVGDVENPRQSTYIWNDNIVSLVIESDIDYPIIYGRMIFTDRDNNFFNYIDTNNTTLLRLELQRNTLADSPTSPIRGRGDELGHTFILDRVEILRRDLSDVTYAIEFTSIDWANYNNYLPYSSVGPKQHLSILKELFNRSGLKLKVSEGATAIDKESTFITPTNYTLADSIKYILSISADEDTFVYNFIYDYIRKEYRLFSPKKDLQLILNDTNLAGKLVPNENILVLNSRFGSPVGKISKGAIYELSEDNTNGATHNIEKTKDLLFYHYDQTTRQWKTNLADNKKIINSLPDVSSKDNQRFVNTFKDVVDQSLLKFKREIVPREPFIYDSSIRDIFNDSKILKFKTDAWINRKAGDFIYILIEEQDEMYNKFTGLWFIIKVIKTISGDSFQDVVYACRIERGKPLDTMIKGRNKNSTNS
jgi:hypothetical protein